METSGPTSGISATLATATRSSAGQWRVGQLLQATVTDSRSGTVLFAIGNRQFTAETSLPLKKNQRLTLQVLSLGKQPVLRLTTSTDQSPIEAAIRQLLPKQAPLPPLLAIMAQLARTPDSSIPPIINELIRSTVKQIADNQSAATARGLKNAISASGIFLERQLLRQTNQAHSTVIISSDFKANLLRLVQLLRQWPASRSRNTPQSHHAPGPAPTSGGSSTVSVNGAPSTADAPASRATDLATPAQIRRTVQAGTNGNPTMTTPVSGNTIQTTGAKDTGGTPAPTPLSVALAPPLRGSTPSAQPAVQNNPELSNDTVDIRTHLLHQTAAAIARVQLNQLAALPRDGERGLLEWLFELPVRRGDAIDLWAIRVFTGQSRQQQSRQQQPSWSVQLAFDLPGLGPVQAQVRLTGDQVSTHFWAERQATLPLFREHMHVLHQGLTDAGLDVGELECHPGPRPVVKSRDNGNLINERA